MNIIVDIPVTPAIKKFLEARVGKNYHLSGTDWFGILLINIFEKKQNKFFEPTNKNHSSKTENFRFTMSISMADKNGYTILPKHAVIIHNIVDSIFRETMYVEAIRNKKNYKIEYYTSITNILQSYQITPEEMSYESIKRDFNRKRAKLESQLSIE